MKELIIDKVTLPKHLLIGGSGEIMLVFEAYYQDTKSIYYKKADGKTLLSFTRFYD